MNPLIPAPSLKHFVLPFLQVCHDHVVTNLDLIRERSDEPQGALHVLHVGNGGQQVGHLDLVRVLGLVVHEHHEAGRAHGVADIVELLLPRLLQDVVDHCGDVVLAIFIPSGMYPSGIFLFS